MPLNRRAFIAGVGALVGGVAIEQAIPFNRVWSFPSQIIIKQSPLAGVTFYAREALRHLQQYLMLSTRYTVPVAAGALGHVYELNQWTGIIMKADCGELYGEPREATTRERIEPAMIALAEHIKEQCPNGVCAVVAPSIKPFPPDTIAASASDGRVGVRCVEAVDFETCETRLTFDVIYPYPQKTG